VIPTPAHENASASRDALKSFMEYAASITPLARTGTDEEVAKVVAFLASDDSSSSRPAKIFVDGGIARSDEQAVRFPRRHMPLQT